MTCVPFGLATEGGAQKVENSTLSEDFDLEHSLDISGVVARFDALFQL